MTDTEEGKGGRQSEGEALDKVRQETIVAISFRRGSLGFAFSGVEELRFFFIIVRVRQSTWRKWASCGVARSESAPAALKSATRLGHALGHASKAAELAAHLSPLRVQVTLNERPVVKHTVHRPACNLCHLCAWRLGRTRPLSSTVRTQRTGTCGSARHPAPRLRDSRFMPS